jgi:arylsulfatase A
LLVDAASGYVSGANREWEVRHGYKPDDKGPVELYNLKTDIAQKHNLAAQHPERVAELQALLEKIRGQGHSAPRLAK